MTDLLTDTISSPVSRVVASATNGVVSKVANDGPNWSASPSSPVGSAERARSSRAPASSPPTYQVRTAWITTTTATTAALRPNMTRGFARIARNDPSRISPRPRGRSGTMPGCTAGGRQAGTPYPVSYTHLRAHETRHDLV